MRDLGGEGRETDEATENFEEEERARHGVKPSELDSERIGRGYVLDSKRHRSPNLVKARSDDRPGNDGGCQSDHRQPREKKPTDQRNFPFSAKKADREKENRRRTGDADFEGGDKPAVQLTGESAGRKNGERGPGHESGEIDRSPDPENEGEKSGGPDHPAHGVGRYRESGGESTAAE